MEIFESIRALNENEKILNKRKNKCRKIDEKEEEEEGKNYS